MGGICAMKLVRFLLFTVFSLVLLSVAAQAHGPMITVLDSAENPTRYAVIPEEQFYIYASQGWTDKGINIEDSSMIPMYTDDGRVHLFPYAMADSQSTVGWHYSPRKKMYTPDNKNIVVNLQGIETFESVGWFIEPVALMAKDGHTFYALQSEMDYYRQNGYLVKDYTAPLYTLGTQIKDYISRRPGTFGVYIKNLKTGDQLIINDGKYSAASIIKLFVMAGVMNELEQGNLAESDVLGRTLYSMITVSDNYSSNYLVKTMGGGNYHTGFQKENANTINAGCLNTQHLSLFSGYGDYVSYGRNWVSPYDCGILLEKIYNRTLVSPEKSDRMLALLKDQQRRNKIPYPLPQGTVCANKTGETSTVQSDVGIVYSPNCDYIICVTTNNATSGIFNIRDISLMTYNYFNLRR